MHASACEGLIRILPSKGRVTRRLVHAPENLSADAAGLRCAAAQSIAFGVSQS